MEQPPTPAAAPTPAPTVPPLRATSSVVPHEGPASESLEDKMKKYVDFADDAYSNGKTAPKGYHVDSRFSNQNRTLFASDDDPRKAVYAFRGTDPKASGDIGTDVLSALHLERFSARYQNAARYAQAAQDAYPDLTLTGHSLGAGQALFASSKLKRPPTQTVAYSPHISWAEQAGDRFQQFHDALFGGSKAKQNTFIFKTALDPVSAYVDPHYSRATVTTVRSKSLNPHSLDNFR
jgi:hypothetical protein